MEKQIINNTYLRTGVVKFWAGFLLWGSFSHNKIHKSAQVQNFRKKQLLFFHSGIKDFKDLLNILLITRKQSVFYFCNSFEQGLRRYPTLSHPSFNKNTKYLFLQIQKNYNTNQILILMSFETIKNHFESSIKLLEEVQAAFVSTKILLEKMLERLNNCNCIFCLFSKNRIDTSEVI